MFRTADEFYQGRDRRTVQFTGARSFERQRVVVVLHPGIAETYRGQLMFLLAVNLVSRYARTVLASCPDIVVHSLLGEEYDRLPDEALAIMHGADPFGLFTWTADFPAGSWNFTIQVGAGELPGVVPSVTVDADGWCVSVSQGVDREVWVNDDADVPVGPGTAAALAVAEAMKAGLGRPVKSRITRTYLSLWDYSIAQGPLDMVRGGRVGAICIGKTWLVGAGMVGSSLAYFLRRFPIRGELHIIDHDVVAIHNLNRSPVFRVGHVGTRKASLLAGYLRHTDLQPVGHSCLFQEFVEQNPRLANGVDLILPEANQYKVRVQIQHQVPPLMIHATTSRNGGVVVGYHRPVADDCLACRFPDDAEQPDMACGALRSPIVDSQESQDIALPYQATLAAAMLTGQIIQAAGANFPATRNYALLDTLGPVRRILTAFRRKAGGCSYCQVQTSELHEVMNGGTLFAHHWKPLVAAGAR